MINVFQNTCLIILYILDTLIKMNDYTRISPDISFGSSASRVFANVSI